MQTAKHWQVRIHAEGNSKIIFVLFATIFPCTGFACISVYTFFKIHCTGNSTGSISVVPWKIIMYGVWLLTCSQTLSHWIGIETLYYLVTHNKKKTQLKIRTLGKQ